MFPSYSFHARRCTWARVGSCFGVSIKYGVTDGEGAAFFGFDFRGGVRPLGFGMVDTIQGVVLCLVEVGEEYCLS